MRNHCRLFCDSWIQYKCITSGQDDDDDDDDHDDDDDSDDNNSVGDRQSCYIQSQLQVKSHIEAAFQESI